MAVESSTSFFIIYSCIASAIDTSLKRLAGKFQKRSRYKPVELHILFHFIHLSTDMCKRILYYFENINEFYSQPSTSSVIDKSFHNRS